VGKLSETMTQKVASDLGPLVDATNKASARHTTGVR
jgi:hypothetical protein